MSAYIKDYAQGTGIFSENFIVGGKDDILTKAEGGIARLGFNNGGDLNFGGIKEAIKGCCTKQYGRRCYSNVCI